MKRINLELSDDLYTAVRAAAGDVPVNRWLRRAVEQALGKREPEVPISTPPERPLGLAIQQAARSSRQAKDFKPYPKKGKNR